MASHASGSSTSRSRSRLSPFPHQVVCYHNEVAPLRMVKYDGPTKGKRFYGCSYWPCVGGDGDVLFWIVVVLIRKVDVSLFLACCQG
uniref:Zinc finger GRF-type domain-containing protein n=1 Tax=Chenopodium quinoa TaxID=63459 RepID=A0A803N433_CHEQI